MAISSIASGDTKYGTELKNKYGLQATISLIDTYILETEFEDYIDLNYILQNLRMDPAVSESDCLPDR